MLVEVGFYQMLLILRWLVSCDVDFGANGVATSVVVGVVDRLAVLAIVVYTSVFLLYVVDWSISCSRSHKVMIILY